MKITLEQLTSVLDDPQYQEMILDLAQENTSARQWWAMADSMLEQGARTIIWECCQWVAVLFDTYEGVIKTVKVEFDQEADRNDIYMTSTVLINGEVCFDGFTSLAPQDEQACEKIDNCDALSLATEALNTARNSNLLSRLHELEQVFSVEFTSAKQAREMAAEQAKDHQAFFMRKILGMVAQKADIGDQARPKSRGGPKV